MSLKWVCSVNRYIKKLFLSSVLLVFCQHVQAVSPFDIDKLGLPDIKLASVKAVVIDVTSGTPLHLKKPEVVVPIASISKLMTAMVVLDAHLPLDNMLKVTRQDRDRLKHTRSRIRFNSRLSRRNLLLLALMSSENRAASALGRNYPGGLKAFVKAMNLKAKRIGMTRTRFVEPTGLSKNNVSTASDLVKMVLAASSYPLIREFTTTAKYVAKIKNLRYKLQYVNTNLLVRHGRWDISLSKTGFIREAGRCLVMLTEVDGHQIVMVMLDAHGKRTPIVDAKRIKKWVAKVNNTPLLKAALD